MRWSVGVAWAAVAGAVYVALAAAAQAWNADLAPGPLWLATAGATAVALAAPPAMRALAVIGTALGGVASGLWWYDESWRTLVAPVVANTAEVALVVVATARLLPAGPSIRRTRDAVAFLAIAIVASCASATIAIVDTSSNVVDARWDAWWRWVVADTTGQLLLVPIVLTWSARLITPASGRRLTELLLTLAGLVAAAIVSLSIETPFLFLTLPVVMWLAIRFGPRVTTVLAPCLAIAVAAASSHGVGPLAGDEDPVAQAQLFDLAIALTSLIGGAHALRAWRDHARLAGVLAAMPDVVLVRDEHHDVIDAWVPTSLRAAALTLDPGVLDRRPIVDDEPLPVEPPSLVGTDDGTVFERRAASTRWQRTIEFYRDVTAEQHALTELRRREEAIEDARTAEQARIAKAIHDSPLQLLAAAKIRMEAVATDAHDAEDRRMLSSAADLVAQTMVELRGQITALMPPDVAAGAVVPALEQLARRVLEPHVEVVVSDALTGPLDAASATVLYQVGREAISNAAKHARPTRVEIGLASGDGRAELSVVDDGIGPTALSADRRHIGLALARERVGTVGGDLRFVQREGRRGTVVSVSVPLVAP